MEQEQHMVNSLGISVELIKTQQLVGFQNSSDNTIRVQGALKTKNVALEEDVKDDAHLHVEKTNEMEEKEENFVLPSMVQGKQQLQAMLHRQWLFKVYGLSATINLCDNFFFWEKKKRIVCLWGNGIAIAFHPIAKFGCFQH
jgi:hypothetical protein